LNRNLESSLEQKKDRRGLLALIGGGGAAAIAALVAGGSKDADAAHDLTNVLHVGQENISPAGAFTTLTGDSDEDHLLTVENQGSAKAIVAIGGISGHSEDGAGGEFGTNTGIGAWGQAQSGVGVLGGTWGGVGVIGAGGFRQADPLPDPVGPGVLGFTPGEDAPGVRAVSGGEGADPLVHSVMFPVPDGGLALDVVGKARFSTAGEATVPQGENAVFVPNTAVTADSHVSVTLAGNPGSRQLHYVSRSPGAGFTLNLTSAPPPQRPATPFTYLIVEQG